MSASDTLVFFHGALGDGVLLWPLLRALQPLTLVGPSSAGQLAALEIDGLATVDDRSPGWTRLFADARAPAAATDSAVPRELLAARRIVSFVSDGADAWARNVAALHPNCQCWFASPTPPNGVTVHVTEFRSRQLARAGLQLPLHDVTTVRASSQRRIRDERGCTRPGGVVLAPGSGSREKCWPPAAYERLAGRLIDRGVTVRILMGHVETERLDSALRRGWEERFDVRYPPTPIELADEIRFAHLYVGNDSGPTQLAAQLGVATVALFGPTDPRVWSPVGDDVTVIAPPAPRPMDWLAYENVERIVNEHVDRVTRG
ncbi:MAG: hypothetical protein E4H03_12485, partial [Myxococcales bacterium]